MKTLLHSLICVALACACSLSAKAQSTSNQNKSGDQTETQKHSGKNENKKVVVQTRPEPQINKKTLHDYGDHIIIRVRAIFRADGKVEEVKALKITPDNLPADIAKDLTEKVIDAARQIKFTPAIKDGHPVSVRVTLEYDLTAY